MRGLGKWLTGASLALALIIPISVPTAVQAAPPVQEVGWRDLSAWLVSDDSLPLITLKMGWRGGSAGEAAAQAGRVKLMARLLNEGAGALPAQAFQQAMADKAMSFGANANHDEVTATLRCLKAHQTHCFELLRLALTAPRFDQEAIDRMKAAQRAAILRSQQSANAIAADAFRKLAYPNHPYGRAVDGTLQSLAAIDRAALVAQHQSLLARDNLHIAVVGDMSRAETRRMLRDVFAELPAQSRHAQAANVTATAGPKSRHIDRPGPQTTVTFGHQAIGYQHPLFFPAFVMNSILGGSGFSSRLTEAVREERGLAYSVYSYLAVQNNGAMWRGGVASDNKTAQQAIDVIRGEMRRIAAEGVSAERLAAAKTYMTGAYALRFDSGSKIAGQLLGIQLMGWPMDYLLTRNQRINAVTQDDIKRAAALLLADKLLVVSVGGSAVSLAE